MEDDENIIGGLMTGQFKRGTFTNKGYGIYLTDERLVGVKKSSGAALKEVAKGGGNLLLAEKTMTDKEKKELESLLEESDFSLQHDEIKRIVLDLPGWITNGSLKIIPENGETIKIKVYKGFTTSHGRELRDILEESEKTSAKLEVT